MRAAVQQKASESPPLTIGPHILAALEESLILSCHDSVAGPTDAIPTLSNGDLLILSRDCGADILHRQASRYTLAGGRGEEGESMGLLRCGEGLLNKVLRSSALFAPAELGNPGVLQSICGSQAAVVIPVQQLGQEVLCLL